MNLSVVGGLVLTIFVFGYSTYLSLGGVSAIIDYPSIVIVIGGTVAAAIIAIPPSIFKATIKMFKNRILKKDAINYGKLVEEIVILAKAYRKGSSSFDQAVKQAGSPFLRDAASILFWTEAEVTADEFRHLLETRAMTYFKDAMSQPKAFKIITKFPPAFGMMGTILGLVALLRSLSDPDAKSIIGPAMAVALITTLYGIAINNLFLVPLAEALVAQSDDELKSYNIVIEGIMLIQQKKPTKYIEEKLVSYLMPNERPAEMK